MLHNGDICARGGFHSPDPVSDVEKVDSWALSEKKDVKQKKDLEKIFLIIMDSKSY